MRRGDLGCAEAGSLECIAIGFVVNRLQRERFSIDHQKKLGAAEALIHTSIK